MDGESFHVKILIRHAQGFIKIKFAFEFRSHKNIISRKRGYKQICLGIHVCKPLCALSATRIKEDAVPSSSTAKDAPALCRTYGTSISHVWLKPSCRHDGSRKASLPVTLLLSARRVRGGRGPSPGFSHPWGHTQRGASRDEGHPLSVVRQLRLPAQEPPGHVVPHHDVQVARHPSPGSHI